MDILGLVADRVAELVGSGVAVSTLGLTADKESYGVALLASPIVEQAYMDGSHATKATIAITYRTSINSEKSREIAVSKLDLLTRQLIQRPRYTVGRYEDIHYTHGQTVTQLTPKDAKNFIDFRVLLYVHFVEKRR